MKTLRPSFRPLVSGGGVALVALLGNAACSGEIVPPDGGGGRGAAGPSLATGGSSATGSGGAAGVPRPIPLGLEGSPIYARFLRLTNSQWENAVTDVLRLTAKPGLAASFEAPVTGSTDFTNNELVLNVTGSLWSSYQLAAETVAARATSSTAALSSLYAGTDRDGFVSTVGRRAFRRPLDASELQKYGALFDSAATLSGAGTPFQKGAELVIRALLQSPFFLYRSELGRDGAPLNGYEVASKLSFWLRDTTPSDQLLDAAAAGQLDSPEGIAGVVNTMLSEPAVAETMKRFHAELYHFARFANIDKAGVPGYTTELNVELQEASVRFFDRLFTQNLGVREMLTSSTGFVGPRLAPLYGLSAPPGGQLAERELGPHRVGFFTQVPFLILYALNAEPDSIHRGVALNLDVLCADPGTPNVVLPEIPPLAAGESNRERITALTGECGSCHSDYINPLGFAFEHFDGMGQYRDTDNGKQVDASGAYPFIEGYTPFDDATDLMQIMANSMQAHGCYAKKLSSYALQRDMVEGDLPLLETLAAVGSEQGGSIKKLVVELAKHPSFRTRSGGAR